MVEVAMGNFSEGDNVSDFHALEKQLDDQYKILQTTIASVGVSGVNQTKIEIAQAHLTRAVELTRTEARIKWLGK